MTAVAASAWLPTDASDREWAHLSTAAPQLVVTMRRYLVQLATFLAPRSVEAADQTLRQFARWLTTATDLTVVAGIERSHIEDYKVWLADQPGRNGSRLAKNTQRQRLRMIPSSWNGSSNGTGPTHRAATRSSTATSHPAPSRSRSSSPINRPPRLSPPPNNTRYRAIGSSPKSSPAPDSAPPNSANWPPTPWRGSAPTATGSGSQSASSATTA